MSGSHEMTHVRHTAPLQAGLSKHELALLNPGQGFSTRLSISITRKPSKNPAAWDPPGPHEIRSLGWAISEKLFGGMGGQSRLRTAGFSYGWGVAAVVNTSAFRSGVQILFNGFCSPASTGRATSIPSQVPRELAQLAYARAYLQPP